MEGNKTSKAGKNYGNEFRNLFQSLEPAVLLESALSATEDLNPNIGFTGKCDLSGYYIKVSLVLCWGVLPSVLIGRGPLFYYRTIDFFFCKV